MQVYYKNMFTFLFPISYFMLSLLYKIRSNAVSYTHLDVYKRQDIDRTMITLDSWGGYPDSTFISRNIFYAPESS